MIRQIQITNFKSIKELTLELGRVNVLIGENGGGKSNILEAIALASAASQDKLGNEFLAARGIRATEPRFMRAAFEGEGGKSIDIAVSGEGAIGFECSLQAEDTPTYPRWVNARRKRSVLQDLLRLVLWLKSQPDESEPTPEAPPEVVDALMRLAPLKDLPEPVSAFVKTMMTDFELSDFLIYSPENSALRIFQGEGQILPLGIRGEGLFAHLKALNASEHAERLAQIVDKLTLIDWFERLEMPEDLAPGERSILIRDRYLAEGALFDQRSANEGFLLLLFYFTLFISPDTPRFFAVDNIDASLNPKLCRVLVEELVVLAKEHSRQVILTTHNPAVLDGINLHDDEQRLFVASRNASGHTKLRRVPPPKPLDGEPPVKLSEAFMSGYIGGLPKNF